MKQKKEPIDIPATLARVEQFCRAQRQRMTPVRRQILSLILAYPDVIKAYDVLADLKKIQPNAAPPTVYRALDFFVAIGVLHRAEALNGFVFCPNFDQPHLSIILSCRNCGTTYEANAPAIIAELERFCREQGFELQAGPLVLRGYWQECSEQQTHHCCSHGPKH